MTTYSVYIQFFKDEHKAQIGQPYLVNWGKDNKIMKELADVYGAKKLTRLISIFFQEIKKDEFLQRAGASIGVLKSQIPKLLLKLGNENDKLRGKW